MKLMIGVSTEQNTVNLIPAIQLKIDKLILVETSHAHQHNWSKGLLEVLKSRDIQVEIISLDKNQDNRIDFILDILYEEFCDSKEQLIWNIGGGQKPHQIAIWQTFNELKRSEDFVCYSNPSTKKIEIWSFSDDELIYNEQDINVNISAEEIFKVYGQKVLNKGEQFYKKNQRVSIKPVSDLFKFSEFRKYFFSLSGILETKNSQSYTLEELKNIFDELKKNITLKNEIQKRDEQNINSNLDNYSLSIKNNTLDFAKMYLTEKNKPKEITLENNDFINQLRSLKYYENKLLVNYELIELLVNKKPKKPSNYFEEIIVKRAKKLLESSDDKNFIFEAYANFESISGEYDILLVTTWGTLIALDAKTFEVGKKDSDARLYNLTLSGGKYVDWIPVIPYDSDCNAYMSDKLKKLPKTLYDMKKRFFVISDNYSKDYQHNIDTIEIPMLLFSNFLTHLKLI